MKLMRSLSSNEIRDIINKSVPLDSLGDFKGGSIFCPFHRNEDTEAAVFHANDADGIQKIWCYNCKKQFTAYDYLTLVLNVNPLTYVFGNYTEEEINEILTQESEIELSKVDIIENVWCDSNDNLIDFINNLYIAKTE